MQQQSKFFLQAGPLLLVLFIDGMGLGLVIPILNDLVFSPSSQFISKNILSPTMNNIIYGAIIGVFMFSWFFGAAILGDLSDQIGRKKALFICLFGAFLSYILSAVAVLQNSLLLMLIGRIVAGFTSGSQPIAQAAIVDLSTPENKPRNIGYILLALSLGFIFGPLIGGILADPHIVSWFTNATPFYFAAIISFFNIIILSLLFKETYSSRATTFSINPYQAVNIFISAFKNIRVKNLSILFFIYIFGWSSFYTFVALFLLKVYFFTPTQVSLYMTLMGVGFGIGNGFLANFMAKRFSLRTSYISFTIASGILILLMVLFPIPLLGWLLIAPIACFIATSYSSLLTIFSNQVDASKQGWIMGITGSISAFVWGLNGIVLGIIAALHDSLPLYTSAIFLMVAGVATFYLYEAADNTA